MNPLFDAAEFRLLRSRKSHVLQYRRPRDPGVERYSGDAAGGSIMDLQQHWTAGGSAQRHGGARAIADQIDCEGA
jgi:hypothetical protein